MRPLSAEPRRPRRDPAPSRLRYRIDRLWLRPWVRRTVNLGVPGLALVLASWTLFAQFDARDRVIAAYETLRESVVRRPQFQITSIEVPEASPDLAEQIRTAAFVTLPANSLEVDVNAVRDRVEALGAVERARVRVLTSGVLEIRAIERVPAVVWRSDRGIMLLDQGGARVAEVDSRRRRVDLPLIAGAGADAHVGEALALVAEAAPVRGRLRGLVRIGERRWDLVLDRGQVIRLPEAEPEAALKHAMALETGQKLLEREVTTLDLRDPRRPMLGLTPYGKDELARVRAEAAGGDA
ncbi:cell division protein FtsQ/DivIB [Amaricoccus solimangrovi]|uniref:Cell division protein FtsQ n=1 Tax=Amaricoccus solimangrovi TaxID=2589815 RepID=A0A501WLD4_9RHOB|nr:cell division protein FtsQ/DivIB [Amaricoccus solimangrovi]TPE50168.1 cell division protein FtsQ [Amaricoccus solimangrovi]